MNELDKGPRLSGGTYMRGIVGMKSRLGILRKVIAGIGAVVRWRFAWGFSEG